MKCVTREQPKIDRVACPWLIARFIDKDVPVYVPLENVNGRPLLRILQPFQSAPDRFSLTTTTKRSR